METSVLAPPPESEAVSRGLNPPLPATAIIVDISDKHNTIIMIDPRRVRPLPDQPRHETNPGFSPESIADLAESILAEGQIEPVLITFSKERRWDADLVDGERRQRACLHGKVMLRARVDLTITDAEEHFIKSTMANFHREPHTCIEIMYAIKRMQKSRTNEQIATVFGRSVAWVNQHISLLRLDPSLHPYLVDREIESEVEEVKDGQKKRGRKPTGKLTFRLAIILSGLPRGEQLVVATEVLSQRMSHEAARIHVLKYIEKNDIPSKQRSRPPSEAFQALEGAVRTGNLKLGRFIDFTPRRLREIFLTQPERDRVKLGKDLRELAFAASSLADIIDPQKK